MSNSPSSENQPQQADSAALAMALDQDLSACGIVDAEVFDLLDLAYWYDSAATVGWVEQRLRVLAARLDRGEGLSLLDATAGRQVVVSSREELNQWVAMYFPAISRRDL